MSETLNSKPRASSSCLKLLITGVFSSGKTTLANLLRAQLDKAGVRTGLLSEVPRRSPFALNKQQTPLASAWLLGEQIRAEADAAVWTSDLLICDRGIPDVLSHSLDLEYPQARISLEDILTVCRGWAPTYDLILVAKADPLAPIAEEGVRVADKAYQAHLERQHESALELLGRPFVELPTDTVARVSMAERRVLDLLRSRQAMLNR